MNWYSSGSASGLRGHCWMQWPTSKTSGRGQGEGGLPGTIRSWRPVVNRVAPEGSRMAAPAGNVQELPGRFPGLDSLEIVMKSDARVRRGAFRFRCVKDAASVIGGESSDSPGESRSGTRWPIRLEPTAAGTPCPRFIRPTAFGARFKRTAAEAVEAYNSSVETPNSSML